VTGHRLEDLTDRTIVALSRRGKFLIVEVERQCALVVHLGMSGRLVLGEGSEPHTQVVLEVDDACVRLVDPRTFGEVFVDAVDGQGVPASLAHLGPDVLVSDPELLRERLEVRARRERRAVKAALLDQRVVAGLGNMYADEALFRAGVHPATSMAALDGTASVLAHAAHEVVVEAAALGGTTFADRAYRDPLGRSGRFGERLAVYQRRGRPCPRCGTAIVREWIAGRSAHLCPRCQEWGVA
jgi:formamidopyrimidine-DNA glycosylase